MKKIIVLTLLILGFTVSAQRIVIPGQDLLFPHLNDPSYIGKSGDVTAMGMLQISDYERKQHSQFVNAQLPVAENLSFGVDYFKDAVDYYNYSTAMASAAYKINIGGDNSYFRIGVSAGIDSRRQDRFPINEIPNMEEFVPRINESDIGFVYRAGLHYNWNNLSIGGFYNRVPIQSVLARNNIEDVIGYWIEEGFTANIGYGISISEKFRVTPVFRYLSYAIDPIYEGALLIDVGDWVSASVSYKNDYSINPAIRFELFDALQIGYSYEMAMGDVNFEDVHSLSIAYKIKSDGRDESEWKQNAKATNKKVTAIKPKKEKKQEEPVQKDPEPIIDEPIMVKETPKPVVVEQEEEKPEPKVVQEKQPKVDPPTKRVSYNSMLKTGYYVVVDSFDTMNKAEAEKQRLQNADYFSIIGQRSGDSKFYLYIDSDKTKGNAEKRLRAHKLDKNFKNAYLLKVD